MTNFCLFILNIFLLSLCHSLFYLISIILSCNLLLNFNSMYFLFIHTTISIIFIIIIVYFISIFYCCLSYVSDMLLLSLHKELWVLVNFGLGPSLEIGLLRFFFWIYGPFFLIVETRSYLSSCSSFKLLFIILNNLTIVVTKFPPLFLFQKPIMLHGHERPITQIKYNPAGDLLFTASKDPVPNVWFSLNGERLGTFDGHQGAVWSIDVSYDSKHFVSGAADRAMK